MSAGAAPASRIAPRTASPPSPVSVRSRCLPNGVMSAPTMTTSRIGCLPGRPPVGEAELDGLVGAQVRLRRREVGEDPRTLGGVDIADRVWRSRDDRYGRETVQTS